MRLGKLHNFVEADKVENLLTLLERARVTRKNRDGETELSYDDHHHLRYSFDIKVQLLKDKNANQEATNRLIRQSRK